MKLELIEELERAEELLNNFEKQIELVEKYKKLKLIRPIREPPYTLLNLN